VEPPWLKDDLVTHSVVSLQGLTAWEGAHVLGEFSRDSGLHFCLFCFRMPKHYGDMTVNNSACHCCAVIFSQAFLSGSPWGEWIINLMCDLTAPFVILHNCCHPGKTKLFFSLVNSPTLSLEPFWPDRPREPGYSKCLLDWV
jgi:hypothetical protein